MVTASTLHKEHLLPSRMRLRYAHDRLLALAEQYGWKMQAWAVLSNNYHFVAVSPELGAANLPKWIGHFHTDVARYLNRVDGVAGRKVWHNYWESQITFERSHFARLKYVNENPVKHGIVDEAIQYPWCSASWFKRVAKKSLYETVQSFPIDSLSVYDDF